MSSPNTLPLRELGTDTGDLISIDTLFVECGWGKSERNESDPKDVVQFGGSTEIEFKILVKVKCKTSHPEECGEIVPFAASWTRLYGPNGHILDDTTYKNTCKAEPNLEKGVPWCSDGPLKGQDLGVDFPCEIFYRKEFNHIDRSKAGFKDLDANETNTVEDGLTRDKPEIGTALQMFDVVLRDEPSFTIPDEVDGVRVEYVKYEFQSAYLIRDPKRGKAQVAFRRHVTFLYGTQQALRFTSKRPIDWKK